MKPYTDSTPVQDATQNCSTSTMIGKRSHRQRPNTHRKRGSQETANRLASTAVTTMSDLLPEEQEQVDRFIADVREKVSGYESAEAFEVSSREDFESVLKTLPDKIVVISLNGELD